MYTGSRFQRDQSLAAWADHRDGAELLLPLIVDRKQSKEEGRYNPHP